MKLKSINPATEELLGEFDALDMDSALAGAQACGVAQVAWADMPIKERCELLKKLAEVTRAHVEDNARLMTLEMGKPITQARAEAEKCALVCEYYAENAAIHLTPDIIKTESKKSYVRFDPLGVVLAIMPWNFPFWQVYRAAVPALAAGNGMILKHASNVPQCALKIEEMFKKAGFPEGIFKTLLIDSGTASALIEHECVDAVTLTGSTGAGSNVAALAGANLKKCVLELGGSDPFIVLADAELNLSCEIALKARTQNNGQSCIAAKRFILERPIAEEFEKRMIDHFKTLVVGDPIKEEVNTGPLAKADIRDDIERQVNDAVAKGARVLTGGKRPEGKGYFFEPTLLADVKPGMAVYTEETFGPVMSLFAVDNAEDAVALANSSEFGLGGSIWTADLERGEKLATRIQSGAVFVNSMVKSDVRLPFGGTKKSGFGRELGSYGIKEFVNIKTVVVN